MSEQPSPELRPKTWKWILAILAILAFSSTFAAFAILSSIDFNTLKPFVAQVVKQETRRDLEIRGAIDVKLGFRLSLVIHDLLFQHAPWASRPEMVKIRRVEEGGNLYKLSDFRVSSKAGDAQGRVEMVSQGSVATVKAIFRVNQMDLPSLSTEMKLEGKLDLDLDLLSRGSSIAGLMAGLNGGMVAVMGQGRVDNKSIQILGGHLAGGAFELLNPSSKTANHDFLAGQH